MSLTSEFRLSHVRGAHSRILCAGLILLLACAFAVNICHGLFLVVTVASDQPSHLREAVRIYGNVTYNDDPVTEGLVAIQVDDPMKTIVARTLPTGVPSRSADIEVLSFYPCDSPSGGPKSTIRRGTYEYFTATIRNNGSYAISPVRVTINIFDNESIPIDMTSGKISTLAPNQTYTSIPQLWISEWAALGKAVAYLTVGSEFPKVNGYPYIPEKPVTFEIVDLGVDGNSTSTPPENVPGQSYQAAFRLSPEAVPGTYRAYVTAWHQGWKAYGSTSFVLEWMPTPPRASFTYWPPKVAPNVPMTFNASSSTSEGHNDTITSYQWWFSDGGTNTGKVVSKNFSLTGDYVVRLNVTDSEGFWNTTTKTIRVEIIHDMAIVSIECLNKVYSDWSVSIKITVMNKGTTPETSNVTAYYNGILIQTQPIPNLPPYTQVNVSITWNTTGIPYGFYYTLRASTPVLPMEANTIDNNLTFGQVLVRMLGDVVYDRTIDIFDVVSVTAAYEAKEGDPTWDVQADLQRNGIIDIFDVVAVTSRYETSY